MLDLSPPARRLPARTTPARASTPGSATTASTSRPLDDAILQDAKDAIVDSRQDDLSVQGAERPSQHRHARSPARSAISTATTGCRKARSTLNLTGSAGQSFGAFLVAGIRITLTGEANDYVGKGMSGGEIIVRPPPDHNFAPHDNSIVGNTCLYGATGGTLFATAARASASPCATPAPPPWSKAWATTAANT